ncbi:MAG TPA: NUDIX domain-containing protein [Candidatus Saccharimonadales bacterium]|nr:NUDIX domain-containing protein [Candidatus Saccharimonadales bacterium]
MAHIHTEPGHHDLTVSAFVFRTDGDEPKILLHWHKKLHVWMPFGGHVELNETPWAAVAHELLEESGYNLQQLQLLQPPDALVDFQDVSIAHPLPFIFGTHPFDGKIAHYHTDASFLFATKQEPQHEIDESESSALQLFSSQEIQNIPSSKILQNVRVAVLYAFDLLRKWRAVDALAYSVGSPKILGKP